MHAAPMGTRGSRPPPWRRQEADGPTDRQAGRLTAAARGAGGAPWRAAGEGPAASEGARGGGESGQTDTAAAAAPGGRGASPGPEGRADGRAGGRAGAGRAAEAAHPGPSTGGAGAQRAGGAVGALPSPRPPVGALGRGRVVGFGLSGSGRAGEAAGDPATRGARLGHARGRALSPCLPAGMKDGGDSKDQQLTVRRPSRAQTQIPPPADRAVPPSPRPPKKDPRDQGMRLSESFPSPGAREEGILLSPRPAPPAPPSAGGSQPGLRLRTTWASC